MGNIRTVVGLTTGLVAIGLGAAAGASGGAQHGSATIVDTSGTPIGFAKLVEDMDGTVHVNVQVAGLAPGLHGIHIHEVGSCESTAGPFSGAGSHHRATGTTHPDHYGDLPNLIVNEAGRGRLETTTTSATLTAGESSVFDANGSAIVVHALEDKFTATEFGGARVGCGIIDEG